MTRPGQADGDDDETKRPLDESDVPRARRALRSTGTGTGTRSAGKRSSRSVPSGRGRRAARRRRRGLRIAIGGVAAAIAASAIVWLPTPAVAPGDTRPAAPAQIRVASKDTTATATWRSDEAASYRVEYSQQLTYAEAQRQRVDDQRLALRSLAPNTKYFLRVVAIGPDGEASTASRSVSFTTDYRWPAPKLKVSDPTSTALTARWKSAAKGKATFETQLATEPTFGDPQTRTRSKTRIRFSKLEPGTSYWARVRAVDDDGVPQSEWSTFDTGETPKYEPLGVGTYNVLKWRRNNWSARRGPVADLIKNSNVDVVGLQEATPSHIPSGPRHFEDVVTALGGDWAVTRSGGGPTGETRTVYDRTQVELVSDGYQTIAGSARFRGVARYVAWSVFEQKSTGKRFFFVNTHFTPGRGGAEASNRASSARQLVQTVQAANTADLPVMIVGDFNTGLLRTSSNAVYAAITGAGYIDPLVRTGELGEAEKLVDANLKTVNNLSRVAPRRPNPALVDHIFVSRMRVSQWQVAANLDGAGRFIGTIPSDHNLVRATVYLP